MGIASVIESIDRDNFDRCMNLPVNDGLADKIVASAEHMAEIIRSGNDVEIRSAMNGLKIYEVKKKVVR